MMTDLSEEGRMIRDTMTELLATAPNAGGLWAQMAGLGMLGLAVSEEAGGAGLGPLELCLLGRCFGKRPSVVPFMASEVLCLPLLSPYADRPAVQSVIDSARLGGAFPAFAHDDLNEPATAKAVANGYRLNGTKTLVLHGHLAQTLIVSAELDGAPALFLVPGDTNGLTRNPYVETGLGPAADVVLENVALPESALLTTGDAAVSAIRDAETRARLVVAAELVGAMETLLDLTTDYLRTRKQFGVTLSTFQSLQHCAVEMFVEIQLADAMLDYGLGMADAPTQARDVALAAVGVKVKSGARIVAETAVQLHGGIGMTIEHDAGRLFARITALRFLFGDERSNMAHLIHSDIQLLGS